MSQSIKSVNIHAFRGIPDLELNLDGKGLLLKGENATGKSSIVEAFELFFTGKLSTFEGEGTQSLSLPKHAPHKKFKKEDVSIKISFDPGNVTFERTFEIGPEPSEQFKKYFEAAQRGTFVLRRSQILKFVASVPAERFRAIASIIGVEHLDNIELAMKRAYEELYNSVRFKKEGIQSIFRNISLRLGEDVKEVGHALNIINRKLKEANLTLITSFDEVNKATDEVLKTFKESTDIERIVKLDEIINDLKVFEIDEEIVTNLNDLNTKLKPLLEEKSKRELSLREFLIKGQQAVEEDERNFCPLCGQEVDKQKLLDQINKRLKTLTELSREASEVRELSMSLDEKLTLVVDTIEELSSKIELFEGLDKLRTKILKTTKFLTKLIDKVELAKELKLEKEIPIEEFEQNTTMIEKLVKLMCTKCQKLFKKIGIPKDWKGKFEAINLLNQVSALTNELKKIEDDLANEEKLCDIAKKVYEAFSEVKKAKLIEIYNSISGDINTFYTTLHPNEQHKNIELKVVSGRRASTELRMESFGSLEDPRAFASEAHLDSLGLCIFLAFVKKFNEGCNFIILDDVVTTIDAQHRGRICELLFDQFRDYQLFITTHDAIWYEQLCASQRAFKIDGNFKNVEIVKWTFETGPIIEPYKFRWDYIESKIESADKLAAASEGRRYLEWLLKNICETLMARPVFKIGKYTVFDLFAPARSRVEDLIEDVSLKEKILKCFQELEATAIMGNLLVHDNLEAETISMDEVKRFCNAVHELHRVLQCPDCDTFLKYYQDMKRIRCPNPRCEQQVEIVCK